MNLLKFPSEIFLLIINNIHFKNLNDIENFMLVCKYFQIFIKNHMIKKILTIKNEDWNLAFSLHINNIEALQFSILFKYFKYYQITYKENKLKFKTKIKKYIIPKNNLILLKEFCYFYNNEQSYILEIQTKILHKNIRINLFETNNFFSNYSKIHYYKFKGCFLFNSFLFKELHICKLL